jgi:hypothetical protein
MIINEDVAETIGVFIGDGCLSEYFSRFDKRQRRVVLFTGSWENDRKYYEKTIVPILQKKFNVKSNIHKRKDNNSLKFLTFNRELITFLLDIGFSFGEKAKICKIPAALESRRLVIPCIRGIFSADGSVYRRYSKKYSGHPRHYKNYAVVELKMASKQLIEQIKNNLEYFEIITNKITMNEEYYVLRITKQKSVDKFFRIFKIRHPYHLKRYLRIHPENN